MRAMACLLVSLSACDPVDAIAGEAAEQAGERCQIIVDHATQQVLDQCVSLYEDTILPELEKQTDQVVADLKAWLEMRIDEAEKEIMTRLGCVPDASPAGWDCHGADVCLP